jgi:hypothetical protein
MSTQSEDPKALLARVTDGLAKNDAGYSIDVEVYEALRSRLEAELRMPEVLKEIQARNDEGDFRFAFARTDLWRRGQESLPQPELQALKLLLDEWLQQHKDIATLLRLLSRSGPPAVTRDDMARGIAPFILRLAGDYSDVPIDEAFRRPRYTHLRTVFYEAADAIKALLERPQTGERT